MLDHICVTWRRQARRTIGASAISLLLTLTGCGGGGGGGDSAAMPLPAPTPSTGSAPITPDPAPAPAPDPDPDPNPMQPPVAGPPSNPSDPAPTTPAPAPGPAPSPAPAPNADRAAFATAQSTARFLTQATFGPTLAEINTLRGTEASGWFLRQLEVRPNYLLPVVDELMSLDDDDEGAPLAGEATTFGFWRSAIAGADQLRQRMAFALSELLVVSNGGGELLTDVPEAVAYYQDRLIEHALGNYRELLEDVTYAPAMGYYLTYMGSEKGDPATGRMPDENYARELMQLFTIGVVELNADGTVRLDTAGQPIETYDNSDVTGLARVFTGLDVDPEYFFADEAEGLPLGYAFPMAVYPERHSTREKAFLGTVIPQNTPAAQSITLALDHIFAHPNVAPFVARQLIQRLVSSNPTPAYTARVAAAFEAGRYRLPSGAQVGDGRRGDLAATAAAILFDTEARTLAGLEGGKIREPILRFTHWARAFQVRQVTPEYRDSLWDTSSPLDLGQHAYRAPSVFNFFRPGHIAQGSLTGERGLNAPELQIVNASSVPGYANFMLDFIFFDGEDIDVEELQAFFDEDGYPLDADRARDSFDADYSAEAALAAAPAELVDRLDLLLTYGTLTSGTRAQIVELLEQLPVDEPWQRVDVARFAIFMMMTSPDYLVQR
ncbi:MAG: DUF1800 family protein [Pseudomonadota bacterium]